MTWVCDNETDMAVIECQKEIKRLRSVIRQLEEEKQGNLPSVRAVWKDKKVIGYIHLTDQQTEQFNKLENTGIYIGFDRVTNPEAYRGEFDYNGYHFIPERQLSDKENNLRYISSRIYTEQTLGMATYDFEWVKHPWNHEDFYNASTNKETDLFRCSETNLLYLPGENELFGWKE